MKTSLLIIIVLSSLTIYAQKLNVHKWENRIIVIISNDENITVSNKSIKEIEEDTIGRKERKLILYKVFPGFYKTKSERFDSEELYKALNPEKADFKFILIGLDGKIKLEENKSISKKELYKIIDAMPMRASELKNK